jgi:peptide/nickel transport system permease protein
MTNPRLPSNTRLTAGSFILLCIVLVAAFAPLLAPYSPLQQSILNRRIPPVWQSWFVAGSKASWAHILGTDRIGRDYLSRIVYGARISLLIGFLSAASAVAIGTLIGVAAGFWRGWVDTILSFVIQIRLAVPIMLLALTAVAFLGGTVVTIIAVSGLLLWDRAAIVSRALTLQIRERDYVKIAHVLGGSDLRIVFREVLPSLYNVLAVIFTIELSNAILLEASLSFLGLGLRPPAPSWGLMLAEAKEDIFFAPWMIAIPGFALFLLVFSTGLISEDLQRRSGGLRP